jgi:thioredoxin 1
MEGLKMVIELNRDNYENSVLKSTETVLVDFWGPQCRPCLALMPAVEKLEEDYTGKIKVGKVNAAENRMLCARLKVMSLPTFIIYNNGEEISRLVGDKITEKDLIDAVEVTL